jgi:hypothetical protein
MSPRHHPVSPNLLEGLPTKDLRQPPAQEAAYKKCDDIEDQTGDLHLVSLAPVVRDEWHAAAEGFDNYPVVADLEVTRVRNLESRPGCQNSVRDEGCEPALEKLASERNQEEERDVHVNEALLQ